MIDDTLDDVLQRLSQLRAQLTVAETVLARIRAHGDPLLAEKEASTRLLIETLGSQAEALAQRLSDEPVRVLH
jgi:hypothetical protein